METIVFFTFILAVGYLLLWTVVNEKRDPNGGHEGWFAIRTPKSDQDKSDAERNRPWTRH